APCRHRGRRADAPPCGRRLGLVEIAEPIHVDEPRVLQRLAHFVDIEPELTRCETSALLLLVPDARARSLSNTRRQAPLHDHHAVVVRDYHIPWAHERPRADDRDVDRTYGRLDRALRVDRSAPDREAHLSEVFDVAATRVDDEAADAVRAERRREKV